MILPKSKYKGVYTSFIKGKYICWTAAHTADGIKRQKCFDNERDAAIMYDKILIGIGRDPVNILKKQI